MNYTGIESIFGQKRLGHIPRRPLVGDFLVFSWFSFLTTYLAWQRVFPYLLDDEYGVLGAAAVLSGLEWVTPQGMPFYGFVLSLPGAPFYK